MGAHGSKNSWRGPSPAPGLTQLLCLCQRASRQTMRSKSLLLLHVVVTVGAGSFLGLIYWRDRNGLDFAGIQNRIGMFFFTLVFWGLVSMSSLGTWRDERLL